MKGDQRAYLEALAQRVAPELLRGTYVAERDLPVLVDALLAAASFGDDDATAMVRAAVRRGMSGICNEYLRALKLGVVAYRLPDGKVQRYDHQMIRAVPVVSPSGGYTQHMLWTEMTWDEYDAMIAALRVDVTTKSVLLLAHELVQDTWRTAYPGARSPGEVCALAGIDPDAIEVAS